MLDAFETVMESTVQPTAAELVVAGVGAESDRDLSTS